MIRGTFANIRLRNQLAPGTEGGITRDLPGGEQLTIFDAAGRYAAEGVPLLVIAGNEYGSRSSRDWAAKGTALLGVRAVLAAPQASQGTPNSSRVTAAPPRRYRPHRHLPRPVAAKPTTAKRKPVTAAPFPRPHGGDLLNRPAQRYGPAISASAGTVPGFPTPRLLADASPGALRELGFSLAKARAVTALARQVATGDLDLEALRGAEDDRALAVLLGLTGVSRWSAEYMLLRGLGRGLSGGGTWRWRQTCSARRGHWVTRRATGCSATSLTRHSRWA